MHPVGVFGVLDISQRHALLDVHNNRLPTNESQFVCASQKLALSENQGSGEALSENAEPVGVVAMSLLSVQTDLLVSRARSRRRRRLKEPCGECIKILLQHRTRRRK